MNRFFKKTTMALYAMTMTLGFASCNEENNGTGPDNLPSEKLENILTQYVNNTVIATYSHLADASTELDNACKALYEKKVAGTATDSDVKAVCDSWLEAREYWEYSEAFLLGPATIKGIDPHIDSWPLDKTALDKMLNTPSIMEDMDADYITSNYGSGGLCGFHALEYAVFDAGKSKSAAAISANLAKYAYAVSGDLKLQCILLEAAWAGFSNISKEKQSFLEEKDAVPEADIDNYGAHFINAGKAGSRYRTQMEAIVDAIKADKGCYGIANEVGDTKISDPVASGNVLDVESWYSYNSKKDFQDNIRGIQNVIMGGMADRRDTSKSIYEYLKEKNPKLAEELKTSIEECIGEDGKTGIGTIKYPFRDHLGEAENATAIKSCQDLRDKLAEVAAYLQENK